MNEPMYKSEEVTFDGWQFMKLKLEDRPFINERLRASSCPSSNWYNDYSFFWLFGQARPARQVVWKQFGELVVPFAINTKRHRSYLLRLPFGVATPDQYVSVLYLCMAFCYHYNQRNSTDTFVRSVDEDELQFMRRSSLFNEHFTLKERKGIEHHYDIDRICELEGSQFSYIRRKLSKFTRKHENYVVRPYVESDREQMFALFSRWLDDARTVQDRKRKQGEKRYFLTSLDYTSQPEHMMLVAEVDGSIVGMISGGVRAVGDAWCFQRKSLHAYEGLAELLVVELAKAVRERDTTVRVLNDGSDLNDPGLRYFKQRFYPSRSLSRYRLYGHFG